MKKIYTIVITTFLSCHISVAQIKGIQSTPDSNELFGDQSITAAIARQDKFIKKQNAIWAPDSEAYDNLVDREMEVYSQWASLQVPTTGKEYDVKYYRLQLRINPDTAIGKYIIGKVTTYFTTTQVNFSVIKFDFATPLNCDSVYYHGAKLSSGNIARPTDLLEITIPAPVSTGSLDSVSVYYQGAPPRVTAFGGGTGFVKSTHNISQNYIYTLSEPYSSYTWWPCKSFIANDKADSLDLVINTPVGFKAAGNGALVSEINTGANVTTYWKHRYPIAAYQVCIAVANYVQYPAIPTNVNIGGTNMPLYNYLFPETNTATAQATLDRTAIMLTTFSSKFGDYPFKNEKYGHYTFGFGGGMEHNTFSGMNAATYDQSTDWNIIAHELGHQWFGGNVTCGSWGEIWINEGFATFSESICAEFAPGVSAGQTGLSMRGNHKSAAIHTGNQTKSVFITDTTSMNTIFTPSVYIYERGAMVVYMLRTLLGDTKFFQGLKNFQADPVLRYGNAVTADVKRHMEGVSGLNLTSFFNQWIYNTGFASYSEAKWNNYGTHIILQLPQTTQYSPLAHFDMPLAIRIQGTTGDTTIIVYDKEGIIYYDNEGVLTSSASNIVHYNLSFVPTTITFDAFNQVLANGNFTKNSGLIVLATNVLNFTGRNEGDNAVLSWSMANSPDYSSIEIEKSTDGIFFEKIGTIDGSDLINTYNFSFTDYKISPGIGHYRLKSIQKNGAIEYTNSVAILQSTGKTVYTIIPNPASDHIIIKGTGIKEKVDIKIYDATGKLIKKLLKQHLSNNTSLRIAVPELIGGNYFIDIQSGVNKRYAGQLVIIK